jgi:hypothetical protein
VEDLSSGIEGDNRSTKNTDKQIQWRRTKVFRVIESRKYPIRHCKDSSRRRGYRQQGYIFSETTGPNKPEDTHKQQTARRISKLYDWNKSGVKDMLGDCK